jgi:hypothetical protein
MKTLFKLLVILIGFFTAATIATISSAYLVTGFSKGEYIKFLEKIPTQNFGYILIPTIVMSFAIAGWLFKKMCDVGRDKESKFKVDLSDVIYTNFMHVEK